MKFFLANSLKTLSIPFWCPNYFCGSPFISDIQSGVFYPFSLIFGLLPFPQSFNVYIVLHFFLAFCFFYLFIKGLNLSSSSAMITSISYCYGGYTISSINTLNNLSTLIWLPAILWVYLKAQTKGPSGYFLTVFFIGMAILGGEPQLFILIMGLLFLFSWTFLPLKPGETRLQINIKHTIIILFLITSAIALTAIQVGPTYLDYQLSVREGGIAYGEAIKHSLQPTMLKHLIFPLKFASDFISNPISLQNYYPGGGKIPWLLTIYPGFLILPFALFGLFFNFSKKVFFWFAVCSASIILALGSHTPIYKLYYYLFPFFRFPEKFMYLAGFSLLVMSAYGFDQFISLSKQKSIRPFFLTILLSLVLIIDLISSHGNLNPLIKSDFYKTHHPYLQPILDDPDTFRIYLDPETSIYDLNDTIFNHHKKCQMLLMPNLGVLNHISHVNGTTGLELRYQYLITEILEKSWPEKIRFLRLANVKYIISNQNLDKKPELENQVIKINTFIYKLSPHLPRAWMVGQLCQIKTGTIDELINGSFNPFRTAISKGDIVSKYNEPLFRKIQNINYIRNNRISIELVAETPAILVLSESSYPGWKVFVDGKKRNCLWINLLFQGVEIEKGRHTVEFLYLPKYFKIFSLISFTSLIIYIVIWTFLICRLRFNNSFND